MTRQNIIKYAQACRDAYARGQAKPNRDEWERVNISNSTINISQPAKPEKATNSTIKLIKDNARRQEKALKQINITIRNVAQQADILDDFFQELSERHPEYKTYHKLSDYIFGSILDIQEKLQTL